MSCLFVDTGLFGCAVGYSTRGGTLAYESWPTSDKTAFHLESSVKKILSNAAKSLTDLDAIIINSGPGSFTGLKIGLSFVYGCRLNGNPKICALSSLSMIAKKRGETVWLAATRKQGYRAAEDGETTAIDIDGLEKAGGIILGEWPRLSGEFDLPSLSKEESLKQSLLAMHDEYQQSMTLDFSTTNPQASYLRVSSAEQNFLARMNHA